MSASIVKADDDGNLAPKPYRYIMQDGYHISRGCLADTDLRAKGTRFATKGIPISYSDIQWGHPRLLYECADLHAGALCLCLLGRALDDLRHHSVITIAKPEIKPCIRIFAKKRMRRVSVARGILRPIADTAAHNALAQVTAKVWLLSQ